ncbi:MAG: mannitol dehydrogenase family protein [Oligoflexales bacterium]|nr:mannitol dehydrogenase family protein [Oligoflexales bacterium]
MAILNMKTLKLLPGNVKIPDYDINDVKIGIVHLGLGGFFRSHAAAYTDLVMDESGRKFGISALTWSNRYLRDSLSSQDGLYSLCERDAAKEEIRIVGSIREVLIASDDMEKIIDRIASPDVRIVSLTITEKGYHTDQTSLKLKTDTPDILNDIKNPDHPKTALGLIVKSLDIRRSKGLGPLTFISCDNVPFNGRLTQSAVLELAGHHSRGLHDWIRDNASFPSTMVDKITPHTTTSDIQSVSSILGVTDHAAVIAEPFSSWIIEDNFSSDRPMWEKAGVRFVDNIKPYEQMKLRILNASHSLVAYLGYLAGYEYIDEAMRNEKFARLIRRFIKDEVFPTLTVDENTLNLYSPETIISRFSNSRIKYKTSQVASDGSLKVPIRLLPTLRDLIKCRIEYNILPLAIAGWLRYSSGLDEQGSAISVVDPMAETMLKKGKVAGSGEDLVREYLSIKEVFGEDISQNTKFVSKLTSWVNILLEKGAKAAIDMALL